MFGCYYADFTCASTHLTRKEGQSNKYHGDVL